MTGRESGTDRHSRQLQDNLRSRSNAIFVRAHMQNRTQDQRLRKVVDDLAKDRDLRIRKSHEEIWKVSSKECPVRLIPKPEGMPSYLARPRATTLPTPAELASLVPKQSAARLKSTWAMQRSQSAGSNVQPKQYTKMSTRKLSTMRADQVQIWHYRKVLTDREDEEKSQDVDAAETGSFKKPASAEDVKEAGKWASCVGRPKSKIGSPINYDSMKAEQSVRRVMRKLGIRPQSTSLPYTRRTKPATRPKTSLGDCATISEHKTDCKKLTPRKSYLDMYETLRNQEHQRTTSQSTLEASTASFQLELPKSLGNRPKSVGSEFILSRASTPTTSRSILQEHRRFSQITPDLTPRSRTKLKERKSTLMQQTVSSTFRVTPRQRMQKASAQVINAAAFVSLYNEVRQGHADSRRGSLKVDYSTNLEDGEDEDLFDEMRHCRYIRWANEDAELIQDLNNSDPLQQQLELLKIKYDPKTNLKEGLVEVA